MEDLSSKTTLQLLSMFTAQQNALRTTPISGVQRSAGTAIGRLRDEFARRDQERQAQVALTATLRTALEAIQAHDKGLNDPNGDGSGDSAQSPTGDDYNEVCGLLQPIYDALGIVGPCSPYRERNPA